MNQQSHTLGGKTGIAERGAQATEAEKGAAAEPDR
jgi:hypothetical protein